jgi:hypothetical protein
MNAMNGMRVALLFSWVVLSCRTQVKERPKVEVGVFFGGQIQELKRVEVDRAKPPRLGFRVTAPSSLQAESTITYEVVAPGPAGRRVMRSNRFSLGPERRLVDQMIPIPVEARLGIWNIRVSDGTSVLADRAVFLVDQAAHPAR